MNQLPKIGHFNQKKSQIHYPRYFSNKWNSNLEEEILGNKIELKSSILEGKVGYNNLTKRGTIRKVNYMSNENKHKVSLAIPHWFKFIITGMMLSECHS